jgi:hypothetical protein
MVLIVFLILVAGLFHQCHRTDYHAHADLPAAGSPARQGPIRGHEWIGTFGTSDAPRFFLAFHFGLRQSFYTATDEEAARRWPHRGGTML